MLEIKYYCDSLRIPITEEQIQYLSEQEVLITIPNIYDLTLYEDGLVVSKQFGKDVTFNLLEGIRKAKTLGIYKHIVGFGLPLKKNEIDDFASVVAEKSWTEAVASLNVEIRQKIDNILGLEKIASEFDRFGLCIEQNKEATRHQQSIDIINGLKYIKAIDVQSLYGQNICITGTLAARSRVQAETMISERGGYPSKAVTKNTDLLVVGTDPWNTKLAKAKQYNIPCMDKLEFDILLESMRPTASVCGT